MTEPNQKGKTMVEKNKDKLTVKQEKFAQAFVEIGDKTAAYRQAYSTKSMKETSINVNACKLAADTKVALRIKELQDMALEKHSTTVESLLDEYDEAKKLALKIERPEAAIKAIDGKARITGHDKKVIDLKSTDGSMTPVGINWIPSGGGDEQA
jgi:phage terminase small subunit